LAAKADVEGKQKTVGGHGQFGVCRIKNGAVERGKGVEFVDDVFAAPSPRTGFPPIRKASAMPLPRLPGGIPGC